jgi:hypothetical protein
VQGRNQEEIRIKKNQESLKTDIAKRGRCWKEL